MRNFTTALAAAGLLALGACGGSESGSENGADEVNIATDNLAVSDPLVTENLTANAVGNEANALGTDAGNLANAADVNLTGTGNTAAGNSQ
jgi:hypothetical protein